MNMLYPLSLQNLSTRPLFISKFKFGESLALSRIKSTRRSLFKLVDSSSFDFQAIGTDVYKTAEAVKYIGGDTLINHLLVMEQFFLSLEKEVGVDVKVREESMESKGGGVSDYGGKCMHYSILGNLFEVSSKYVPPIQPVG